VESGRKLLPEWRSNKASGAKWTAIVIFLNKAGKLASLYALFFNDGKLQPASFYYIPRALAGDSKMR